MSGARAGKVLHVGISDTPAWVAAQANTLANCHGWRPFVALQVRYNLLSRDAERDLLPAAEALGTSVAAWPPLGGGVLTRKFTKPVSTGRSTRIAADTLTTTTAPSQGRSRRWPNSSTPARRMCFGVDDAPFAGRASHRGRQPPRPASDNLGAIDVTLPAEAITRLDEATGFEVGFPHDFIRDMQSFVYGEAGAPVDR